MKSIGVYGGRGISSASVSSTPVKTTGRQRVATALLALLFVTGGIVAAADLQSRSAQAYAKYANDAVRTFVARAQKVAATAHADGVLDARAGSGDGILDVPDALVHHWVGAAFIRGATLRQALDVSRAYSTYNRMYKAVMSSRVISQQGDTYRVLMRIKEGEGGVNAVLDVRSSVEYKSLNGASASVISTADEIREVKNPGQADESVLPAGRDSGYLWRAHTLTYLVGDKDGVAVVMETIGLSRRFPPMLGWLIEPIARRLGRRSVETSLTEFVTAVRRSAGLPDK